MCYHVSPTYYISGRCETQSLGTGESNGSVPVCDDDYRCIWTIGGSMTGREKPKYSEKHLLNCHFEHYNYHVDWTETELGSPQ